jgi:hypothetical protein
VSVRSERNCSQSRNEDGFSEAVILLFKGKVNSNLSKEKRRMAGT